MARPPLAPQRVLICRTDNIGDVVLTLPLAAYLKQHFPGVEVHFLVRAYAAPVVRQCRFVDQVLSIDDHPDHEAMFAQGGYDTVIFAFPNRQLAKAARRAKVANRVGTSHRLFHWTTCNRLAHFSRKNSPLHEAQLNFFLLHPLGLKAIPTLEQIVPMYGLAAPRLGQADALRAEAAFNVILHPKSNGNGREWPLAHFTSLARLLGDAGATVWVTGSPKEGELIAQQAPELLALPNVRNLCGRFDLAGFVAVIGVAHGLVAGSTGPMHVSAALGMPTLGLFPPIKPLDIGRWGALGVRAQSISAQQRCATCTGVATCTCMHSITPAQVAGIIAQWREPVSKETA